MGRWAGRRKGRQVSRQAGGQADRQVGWLGGPTCIADRQAECVRMCEHLCEWVRTSETQTQKQHTKARVHIDGSSGTPQLVGVPYKRQYTTVRHVTRGYGMSQRQYRT